MDDQIRLAGIIRLEVYGIVVRPIHAGVHHEYAGLDICAFTGL